MKCRDGLVVVSRYPSQIRLYYETMNQSHFILKMSKQCRLQFKIGVRLF